MFVINKLYGGKSRILGVKAVKDKNNFLRHIRSSINPFVVCFVKKSLEGDRLIDSEPVNLLLK